MVFFNTLLVVISNIFEAGIAGIVLGFIIGIILYCVHKISENKKIKNDYQKKVDKYNCAIKEEENRIENEKEQRKILVSQRNTLQKRLIDSKNRLVDFYDTMEIDENYRSLIPIGYMNEFKRLGIAQQLQGIDGLYYLVRKELRQDQFQYTLNDICDKLDMVIDKQNRVFQELSVLRNQSNKMIETAQRQAKISAQNHQLLNQAIANSSITAYNSERITRELAFQNFMMLYR